MTVAITANLQTPQTQPKRYQFSIDEFMKLREAGILPSGFRAELINGQIHDKHSPELHRFSLDEYTQLYETGVIHEDIRTELIDGEILCMTPPGPDHCYFSVVLHEQFRRFLPSGLFLINEIPVKFGEDVVQPDLTIFRGPLSKLKERLLGPPDIELVVEIAKTTLRYDVQEKSKIYARFQIPQLLIVDVRQSKIMLFQQPSYDEASGLATYEQVSTYQRSEQLTITLGESKLTFTLDQILQGE